MMFGMYVVIEDDPHSVGGFTIHGWRKFRTDDKQEMRNQRASAIQLRNELVQFRGRGRFRILLCKTMEIQE